MSACSIICSFELSSVFDFFALLSFFNSVSHFPRTTSLFHYAVSFHSHLLSSLSSSSLSSYSPFFYFFLSRLSSYSKILLLFGFFVFSFSLGLYSGMSCVCVSLGMRKERRHQSQASGRLPRRLYGRQPNTGSNLTE